MLKFLLSLLPFISMPGRLPGLGYNPLTTENTPLIASVLILEAGGDGPDGMYAVGSVIRNRAIKNGTMLTEEVLRPLQFSCLNQRTVPHAIQIARERPRYWEALKIASELDLTRIRFDTTFGATHFERFDLHPYWATNMKKTTAIGHHIFYKRK